MKLPKTTPEQRAELYKDVRSLVWPGFLVHPVTLNGVPVMLRSLAGDEILLLRWRAPVGKALLKDWKAWAVSMSMWMVDGQILLNQDDVSYRLFQMCKGLPARMLDALYSVWLGLMKRLNDAVDMAEAFLYENESRYMWQTDGAMVGMKAPYGDRPLSLNPVQRLWIFFNKLEDERLEKETFWELGRFVVGPHAPKGIKKMQAKDAQLKQENERKRQATMDRAFYEAKGLVPKRKDKKGTKGPWQDIRHAETPEELEEEMRNWVLGIKDDHDKVVDNIKARIRHGVEERRRVQEQRSEEFQRALAEEGITRSELTPLSGQQGQEFLERMRGRIGGTKFVFDDHKHNSAYDKYIRNNPEIGDLAVDTDGHIVSGSNLPTSEEMLELLRAPNPNEKSELQRQVESRRPLFSTDGDSE